MTAEEIRKIDSARMQPEGFAALMLQEIAAQIAELNKNLGEAAKRSHFDMIFGK